ncbi:MAG: hypothetical protein KKE44_05470 [Proteobacteria bacterium]|nr:hypothetical protein [Pseudomonadota bacterium]MBU1582182.1 hypothetical protein [Pseudomonadota bacterium]MBU2631976.1 hypothetical protein [Pseudomonadota bacterium]
MSKYDSDYSENNKRQKHKSPKFRDYYDENLNEEDERELYDRKKKLGKKTKREKNPDHDWPSQ